MARFILRRSREAGESSRVLHRQALAISGVQVLDSTENMLLLEGSEADLRALEKEHPGWMLLRETTVPLPEARPKPRGGTGRKAP